MLKNHLHPRQRKSGFLCLAVALLTGVQALGAEFVVTQMTAVATAEVDVNDGDGSVFGSSIENTDNVMTLNVKDPSSLSALYSAFEARADAYATVHGESLEIWVSGHMSFYAYMGAPKVGGQGNIAVESIMEFTLPADEVLWSYTVHAPLSQNLTGGLHATLMDASTLQVLHEWSNATSQKASTLVAPPGRLVRLHVTIWGEFTVPEGVGSDHWSPRVEMKFTNKDCNKNGIYDLNDIASNASTDYDRNGYPDECNSPVIYVDREATPGGDGSSWQTAFRLLDEALTLAQSRTEQVIPIWIARGTYTPTNRLVADDPRSATFSLPANLYLHGGFAGVEHNLRSRNPEVNPTILSGDLLGDDGANFSNRSDNARHVLRSLYGEPPGDLLLDSIIVRGGHADDPQYNFGGGLLTDARTTLRNCTFEDNWSGPPAEGTVAHSNGGGAVRVVGGIDDPVPGEPDVTWENCRFLNNYTSGTGGGVFLHSISVRFSNCTFEGNRAGYGGAMGIESLFRLYFDNCLFRDNAATGMGGAIVVSYDILEFIVSNCSFEGNSASDGGAVYVRDGAPVMEFHSTSFLRNAAVGLGGAIRSESVSSMNLYQCTFDSCEAGIYGGALAIEDGMASIVGCNLSANTATEGGAIYADDLQLSIEDSIFQYNHATIGGGVVARGSLVETDSSRFQGNQAVVGGAVSVVSAPSNLRFANSLFLHNGAELYGGAVAGGTGELLIDRSTLVHNSSAKLAAAIHAGPQSEIRNSVIWGNSVAGGNPDLADEWDQIEGIPLINHSIIQGWTGAWGGQGNSGANPLFVGRPSGNGEYKYRLQPSSPACNSGDPDYVPEIGETDLDGHARVLCGRVDMGAYESGFGDGDCDGVINAWDFAVWVACAEGELEGQVCETMDSDADGDVDLKDFAAIQRLLQ